MPGTKLGKMETSTPTTFDCLGVRIAPMSVREILDTISAHIKTRQPCVISSMNLHGLHVFKKDLSFRELNLTSLPRVDGMPIVWLGRLLGYPVTRLQRVTWVDLIRPVLSMAELKGWGVFYLGGKVEDIRDGIANIRDGFPGVKIDGHHGHVDDTVDQQVIARIRRFAPDLLIVGMGMPRQERWILCHRNALHVPVIATAGACIEYLAHPVRKPPRWMGRWGLEWLFRLGSNPRRFWHRYLVEPWGVLAFLAGQALRRRKSASRLPSPNIVQIVTQMEAGGAQIIASSIANNVTASGLGVETWFLYTKRPTYQGPSFISLLAQPPRTSLDYALILFRLFVQIRRRHPHAVITHGNYSNVLGAIAAFSAGVKFRVATHHALPSALPRWVRATDRAFGCLGIYTSIVAVSKTVAADFANYPSSYLRRTTIVENGIRHFEPTLDMDAARRRLGLEVSGIVAVTVGRLSAEKNQGRILEASVSLPSLRLLIIGGGEMAEELNTRVTELGLEGRVHLFGEVSPDRLGDILAAADFFVFASLSEAFGLAPLEAAACGLPVAVSDIPAMREIFDSVGEPDGALFFNPRNPTDIADAMRRLAEDKGLRTTLSCRSREIASRYGCDRMVAAYLGLVAQTSLPTGGDT